MITIDSLKHDITEEKVHNSKTYPVSRGPSPNRGTCLDDTQGRGPDSQSQESWRQERGIDRSKQVKLVKLAHMRYQHPDLQEISTFLKDFGMTVAKRTETQRWYRGYGPDQFVYYAQQGPKKFLGGCFEVESKEELEKIKNIPGAKVISDIAETDAPGGGYSLTIEDPEGFPVNFIYGQAPVTGERRQPEILKVNFENEKPRQKAFQRFEPGPAAVHKLGHFGLCVENFAAQLDWYTRHFNLSPTDIMYVAQESSTDADDSSPRTHVPVGIFAHIDRGTTLTDHHAMFLTTLAPTSSMRENHVHHCSFEVHDLDTQALGHKWLADKQYKPVWGVGRHILGSQIFDYWWDTSGFMVEHYADGDLVDENTPIGFGPAANEGLAVWGPEVPLDFLD